MKRIALLVLSTGVAVLLGYGLARLAPDPRRADEHIVAVEPAHALPSFTLSGAHGPIANAQLRGSWWWVVFGYTSCPDICPTTLASLAAVQRQLVTTGHAAPRVLFVSVDPVRDSPAQLQRYVSYFERDFVGATGTPVELERFAAALGARFHVPQQTQVQNYSVGHTTTVMLVDPEGRLVARIVPPLDAPRVARAYLQRWAEVQRQG